MLKVAVHDTCIYTQALSVCEGYSGRQQAKCEWGSCHVLMVFPLRNVEESFPVWRSGFPPLDPSMNVKLLGIIVTP